MNLRRTVEHGAWLVAGTAIASLFVACPLAASTSMIATGTASGGFSTTDLEGSTAETNADL